MDRQREIVKIYNWSFEQCTSRGLAHRIKGLLTDANLEDYFHVGSDNELVNTNYLKRTLLNLYSEKDNINWHNDINGDRTRNGSGRINYRPIHFSNQNTGPKITLLITSLCKSSKCLCVI